MAGDEGGRARTARRTDGRVIRGAVGKRCRAGEDVSLPLSGGKGFGGENAFTDVLAGSGAFIVFGSESFTTLARQKGKVGFCFLFIDVVGRLELLFDLGELLAKGSDRRGICTVLPFESRFLLEEVGVLLLDLRKGVAVR